MLHLFWLSRKHQGIKSILLRSFFFFKARKFSQNATKQLGLSFPQNKSKTQFKKYAQITLSGTDALDHSRYTTWIISSAVPLYRLHYMSSLTVFPKICIVFSRRVHLQNTYQYSFSHKIQYRQLCIGSRFSL